MRWNVTGYGSCIYLPNKLSFSSVESFCFHVTKAASETMPGQSKAPIVQWSDSFWCGHMTQVDMGRNVFPVDGDLVNYGPHHMEKR